MVQINYQFMAQEGHKAGNALVRDILSRKRPDGKPIVSKYRMARDLGVADQTIYNWLQDKSSPTITAYYKIRDYSLYIEKYGVRPQFKPYK